MVRQFNKILRESRDNFFNRFFDIFSLVDLWQRKVEWMRNFAALLSKQMFETLFSRRSASHWSIAAIQKSALATSSITPKQLEEQKKLWKTTLLSLVQRLRPDQIEALLSHSLMDPVVIARPQAISTPRSSVESTMKQQTTCEDLFLSLFVQRHQIDEWMVHLQRCRHQLQQAQQQAAVAAAASTDRTGSLFSGAQREQLDAMQRDHQHFLARYQTMLPVLEDLHHWLVALSTFAIEEGHRIPVNMQQLPYSLRQRIVSITGAAGDAFSLVSEVYQRVTQLDPSSPLDDPDANLGESSSPTANEGALTLSTHPSLHIALGDGAVNVAEDSALRLASALSERLPDHDAAAIKHSLDVVSRRPDSARV